MNLIDLGLFLFGIFAIGLLPVGLGFKALGKEHLIIEQASLGILLICLFSGLLALFDWLNTTALFSFTCMGLFFCKNEISTFLRSIFSTCKQTFTLNRWEKVLCALIITLILFRAFKCLIPTLNWDSLSHHLLLVRERLAAGDLSPLYHIPTDRRTPLFPVLGKCWAMAFDAHGRHLVWLNFCFYLFTILGIYQIGRSWMDRTASLLIAAFYISLTDISIHVLTAGDESLLTMVILAALTSCLLKNKAPEKRHLILALALTGFALAIKLTTLFWLPFLVLWIWLKHIHVKHALIIGGCLLLLLPALSHGETIRNYSMIYPFTRWSNLLQDKSTPNRMFSASHVRNERDKLNLASDADDHGFADQPLERIQHNTSSFLSLPLGPYMWWAMLFLILYACTKKNKKIDFGFSVRTIAFCLASLALSFCLWPLSSQAMFRYHMPLWPVFILSCGTVVCQCATLWMSRKSLLLCLSSFTLFALALEAKSTIPLLNQRLFLNPDLFWEKHAIDGPLIKQSLTLLKTNERVFYIGSNGFLLKGPHLYAQIGNEVGWRNGDDMHAYLIQHNISYWILSHHGLDLRPEYGALTEKLVRDGALKPLLESPEGRVFSVSPQLSTGSTIK